MSGGPGGVIACGKCGSGNAVGTTKCWVCGALPGAAVRPAPYVASGGPADSGRMFKLVSWISLLLGIGFTSILIAVELALEWPGLLVPYALVVLVTFVALGRTAFVHLGKDPGQVDEAGRSTAGVTGTDVVRGVALGVTVAFAVIAALALMAVTAVVLFFVICLAVVMASNSM